ncbi:solute carrier family 22 member 14-like isoform X2 [Saccopteryx bilineata]|uniref:solute carrier family 22 member 14-like isoform X2 n=1 Tax=Saccopteryx bilineata TaxID=59482 RepID=UPI00338FF0A1
MTPAKPHEPFPAISCISCSAGSQLCPAIFSAPTCCDQWTRHSPRDALWRPCPAQLPVSSLSLLACLPLGAGPLGRSPSGQSTWPSPYLAHGNTIHPCATSSGRGAWLGTSPSFVQPANVSPGMTGLAASDPLRKSTLTGPTAEASQGNPQMASKDNLRVELKTQNAPSNFSVAAEQPQSESLRTELSAISTTKDDIIARVLDAVGGFGTFQRTLVALGFMPYLLSSFFMFIDMFVFSAQKAYCNTSWILAVGPNLSEDEQLNLTLPRHANGSLDTCNMYLPVSWDLDSIIQFGLNQTQSCSDGWVYPKSKTRSLVNEFDLVCAKEIKIEAQQTVFMAGLVMGALVFGTLSDRFGRYPTILLSIMEMMIFGFGSAFVSTFQQYRIYRFMVSQALVGYSLSSISLMTEWLTGEHRAHAIVLDQCFYAFGFLYLAGLAYTFSHWRMLYLIGASPIFFTISYIWILPESPRWLMVKGKMKQAKHVLRYAAAVNNRKIPSSLLDQLKVPRKPLTDASLLDFYNNRQLLKVTLAMSCVGFSTGYTFMMLDLTLNEFVLNLYTSQIVHGILGVPARLCAIFLLEQIGRKWSLAVTLFQGTFMTLLVVNFLSELKSAKLLMILLGEFTLQSSIVVVFLYTAELLPTVVSHQWFVPLRHDSGNAWAAPC